MTATAKLASGADRRFDLLSLATFVAVGLPDGMLGTAWPGMRHSFGAPGPGIDKQQASHDYVGEVYIPAQYGG